ncbi:MAG: tetratricopeptide repeat protein [Puniceicoccales bacterium]|nr:tetratricopeptide repeat protein [Puniceicoccales bacterium]
MLEIFSATAPALPYACNLALSKFIERTLLGGMTDDSSADITDINLFGSLLSTSLSSFVSLAAAFNLWMIIHAVWQKNWGWVPFLVLFPGVSAMLYFILVFMQGSASHGFELPGAADRRRIKQLLAQIYNLDKAIFHAQLGDIYFEQGKFAKAESCYRAALQREADDIDVQSHLGQALLRQGNTAEALALLKNVALKDPRHEYGYTLMAYAEALTQSGQLNEARAIWERVIENNTYARARVQLAELLAKESRKNEAITLLDETIADAAHTPAFQRKRERIWVRRAKRIRRQL